MSANVNERQRTTTNANGLPLVFIGVRCRSLSFADITVARFGSHVDGAFQLSRADQPDGRHRR
jgi:hypothetical protein